jgi:hypothetical protein
MRATRLSFAAVLLAVAALAFPLIASAGGDRDRSRDRDRELDRQRLQRAVATFDWTDNMRPIGFSARQVPLNNIKPKAGVYNSDLAFWGETAVQGTYAGFRLIDVDDPDDPEEIIDWEDCVSPTNTVGNQGDVIAWGPRGSRRPTLIIRSWNSPTPAPVYLSGPMAGQQIPATDPLRLTQPAAFCGDWPMFRVLGTPTHPVPPPPAGQQPAPDRGQEGVHIIDVSDPEEPEVVAFVDLPCGSHTETLVPDLRNGRLLVYSNPSSGTVFGSPAPGSEPVHCNGFDIVEVPLDDPSEASYLRFVPTGHPDDDPATLHPCHDTGVILGDVNRVACAGGSGPSVWTIDRDEGGSKDDPMFLYHRDLGTQIGHSASFSWDGEVLIFGHEPGGGTQAQCQATSTTLNRTLFFLDAETGETLAEFLHPRPQTATENCTWHNYNVVPTSRSKVLVAGNYQSGISVVDFSDPRDPEEIAYADPAPLVNPNFPGTIEGGGDWSSYWYDGYIYESDMTRGLLVWRLSDRAVSGARRLGYLNPQTQEFSIDSAGRRRDH